MFPKPKFQNKEEKEKKTQQKKLIFYPFLKHHFNQRLGGKSRLTENEITKLDDVMKKDQKFCKEREFMYGIETKEIDLD